MSYKTLMLSMSHKMGAVPCGPTDVPCKIPYQRQVKTLFAPSASLSPFRLL
ncbi:MAG: hypothetical protein PHE53_01105 [Thermoguttaceae bacterium]|nr:hypothetical protein [Thermoguttaceae bacterium]